jgi:Tol biopolymer transport system component
MSSRLWAVGLWAAGLLGASALRAVEYPVRQLTSDLVQEGFPCWSPDGMRLVFSRTPQDPDSPLMGLWLTTPLGGEPRQLTRVIGEHPDWSPDGSLIVFDGDFGNCLQVVAATGGPPIRILPPDQTITKGCNPKWSPDGTRIAFHEGDTLWLYEPATGALTAAFRQEDKLPIPGCWSQDGDSLYVYLREADSPSAAIWLVSADGEGGRPLTVETDTVYRYMDLSPDGELLAYVRCEGRDCDLWVMAAGGGERRVQITSGPDYDDSPRWSPDGRTVAFTSSRGGSFDIWLVELDIPAIEATLSPQ